MAFVAADRESESEEMVLVPAMGVDPSANPPHQSTNRPPPVQPPSINEQRAYACCWLLPPWSPNSIHTSLGAGWAGCCRNRTEEKGVNFRSMLRFPLDISHLTHQQSRIASVIFELPVKLFKGQVCLDIQSVRSAGGWLLVLICCWLISQTNRAILRATVVILKKQRFWDKECRKKQRMQRGIRMCDSVEFVRWQILLVYPSIRT
jgi:hypothetical protein